MYFAIIGENIERQSIQFPSILYEFYISLYYRPKQVFKRFKIEETEGRTPEG